MLLLLTSVLGLVWNLCALPAYELPRMGFEGPFPYLAAVGFAALGFLPAVVVHSVLKDEPQGSHAGLRQALAPVAYAVSAASAALQVHAATVGAPVPDALAMRLLTYTFVALVVPLAAITRGRPGAGRALWIAALAAFAVSALHLSQLHGGEASWPVELVGHHASVPLAFAILYQDYRFALADLFLKRALALVAIVAVAFAAVAFFGVRSAAFSSFVQADPGQLTIFLVLWIATALLYPPLRRATAWFVDAIVLRRPDYHSVRAAVARAVQECDDTAVLLSNVCDLLRRALGATSVVWHDRRSSNEDIAFATAVITGAEARTFTEWLGTGQTLSAPAACVVIPTADRPQPVVVVGQLSAGRRLLSDDVATLEAFALLMARRIDAIRLTGERHRRELREQEMSRLATEAELRALRAQIHPHFLFNALTTLGYLIQTAPPRALETLLRLTALLRGVLRSDGESSTLGRELELIEAYLEIERARFEHRLRVTIDVPPRLRSIRLPSLLLQPLVENAVKHGIAGQERGGEVVIRATVERSDGLPARLSVTISDTGAGTTAEALQRGRSSGVGLRSVERRLECHYGSAASLSIQTAPGEGTILQIRVPVAWPALDRAESHGMAS